MFEPYRKPKKPKMWSGFKDTSGRQPSRPLNEGEYEAQQYRHPYRPPAEEEPKEYEIGGDCKESRDCKSTKCHPMHKKCFLEYRGNGKSCESGWQCYSALCEEIHVGNGKVCKSTMNNKPGDACGNDADCESIQCNMQNRTCT